ncbi:hypothetical protein [Pseudoxanthomonas wuyuanensis]
MQAPNDKHGNIVGVGTRVRLIGLTGQWLEDLPADEKSAVLSMVGEVFEVEEIDEYGQAWVRKSWSDSQGGTCNSHSIGLAAHEMEVVNDTAA